MHSSFSIIRMLKLYNKIYPLHRTSTKISYCVYNAEIEEYQMKGKYHVSTLRFYMLSVSLVKTRTNLIFSLIKTLKGLFKRCYIPSLTKICSVKSEKLSILKVYRRLIDKQPDVQRWKTRSLNFKLFCYDI